MVTTLVSTSRLGLGVDFMTLSRLDPPWATENLDIFFMLGDAASGCTAFWGITRGLGRDAAPSLLLRSAVASGGEELSLDVIEACRFKKPGCDSGLTGRAIGDVVWGSLDAGISKMRVITEEGESAKLGGVEIWGVNVALLRSCVEVACGANVDLLAREDERAPDPLRVVSSTLINEDAGVVGR